ncbi:hypothetical protein DL89DRAFT_266719 [Linderina pennispora]|uniref:Uncharacterized protein n=1 Tax=Linderina pennispora TaxID=61395 RepID=A0A1Y1WB84_9FUNG|nr:uncharacterized protein DL89DRAFT_266719 [Linderina pennispora]ORX70506.1 hypothetical protein DL89DRAFT_266719 [Linderina pennispora]
MSFTNIIKPTSVSYSDESLKEPALKRNNPAVIAAFSVMAVASLVGVGFMAHYLVQISHFQHDILENKTNPTKAAKIIFGVDIFSFIKRAMLLGIFCVPAFIISVAALVVMAVPRWRNR